MSMISTHLALDPHLTSQPSSTQSRITLRSTTELFGRILLMSLFLFSGLGKIGAYAATMDALKPYLQTAYGSSFDMRIGIHYGEAVIGNVGAIGRERVTAIGDAVNFASRIENANKTAGTRLLISQALYAEVQPQLRIGRSLRVPIPGKSGEYALYEVVGLI